MYNLKFLDALRHLSFVNKQSRNFWLPFRTVYKFSSYFGPIAKLKNKISSKIDNFFKNHSKIHSFVKLILKPLDKAFILITSSKLTKWITIASSIALGVVSGGVVPLTIMSISLFSVFAKSCTESYLAYRLERKARESKLLAKYIDCKKEAIELFKKLSSKDPTLREMLADNIKSEDEVAKSQILSIIKKIYKLEKEKKPGYKNLLKPLKSRLNELHNRFGPSGSKGLRALLKSNLWASFFSLGEAGILAVNTALSVANPIYASSLAVAAAASYIGCNIDVYNNETSLRKYQKDIDLARGRVDTPTYSSIAELKVAVKKMEIIKEHIAEKIKNPEVSKSELLDKLDRVKIKEKKFTQVKKFFKRLAISFNPYAKYSFCYGKESKLAKKEVVSLNKKYVKVSEPKKGKIELTEQDYLKALSIKSDISSLTKIPKLKNFKEGNAIVSMVSDVVDTSVNLVSNAMLHNKSKTANSRGNQGRSLHLGLDRCNKS